MKIFRRRTDMAKAKSIYVYQALGWLAREDKIKYHSKERKTFVSLSHEEREMFKNSLEVFAKSDS